MTRPPVNPLRVVAIVMADGSDYRTPENQARLVRALLGMPQPVKKPERAA